MGFVFATLSYLGCIYRLMSVRLLQESWVLCCASPKSHIHVPDAESSGSVVNRDFHGPRRVAQTNHKEITCICFSMLRNSESCAVPSYCYLRFDLNAPQGHSTRQYCNTHSCVEHPQNIAHPALFLSSLLLQTSCLFLRRVEGGLS